MYAVSGYQITRTERYGGDWDVDLVRIVPKRDLEGKQIGTTGAEEVRFRGITGEMFSGMFDPVFDPDARYKITIERVDE